MRDAKSSLRKQAVLARAGAHAALGGDAGLLLADRAGDFVLGHSLPGHAIAGYWPIRSEIDPRPLLHHLAAGDRHICLPVMGHATAPLSFQAWRPGDDLTAGPLGTFMPKAGSAMMTPDLLLIPLLAFDGHLHRLGYGRGCYDRTLAALRLIKPIAAFGLAYAAQKVGKVPVDAWDVPLDAVLTEAGVLQAEGPPGSVWVDGRLRRERDEQE